MKLYLGFFPRKAGVIIQTWTLGGNPQTMAPAQAQHQANYYRSIYLFQPSARSASKDLEYRSNSANPGS